MKPSKIKNLENQLLNKDMRKMHLLFIRDVTILIIFERFEGDTAVVEIDGEIVFVPMTKILTPAREGDVLIFQEGCYYVDTQASISRRSLIEKKFTDLLK